MKNSKSAIITCFVVSHIFTSLVSSYDSKLEDMLKTEGLIPLHKPQHGHAHIKPQDPPLKPMPSFHQPPYNPPSRQQSEIKVILESEALLPFDQSLSRNRRANPDDNVEGSGGEPVSTTSTPTIQCHQVTCSGQDCLTAFGNDTSTQCTSQGSCYIRARYNETLMVLQTVEARCDTRSSCEWQAITLEEFTEVSNCCNDNLCNDPTILTNRSSKFHQNTVLQMILCLLTISFISRW